MRSKLPTQGAAFVTGGSRRTVTFAFTLTLLLLALNPDAPAQNSVPATAREAMTIPRFAAKLTHGASRVPHPAQPSASSKKPADWRTERGWLPQQNEIYDNGPINGSSDAWTINFGFVVSDTFTVPIDGATVTGLTFGAWTYAGDVAQAVEVSITSSEFGGTTYFDGVVNLTQSNCSGNQYGYNVCTETSAGFNGPSLNNGTYWVNLQNAVVNDGDPLYWDENSGVGCTSSGCPSMAEQTGTGTIPSEAFTITGNSNGCQFNCPECAHNVPQDNFKIIHNFTTSEQPPAPGLAIDQAANLYGATASGGSHGLGLGYKLASINGSWIFDPLYNFAGGAGGQSPLPGIVGPERAVYGTADGGLQQCGRSGTDYCGVVYRLRPSPTVCVTALCSWTNTVVYQFKGAPDGAAPNGNLVFDSAGNLFGTTTMGGLYGQGTVYELTPTSGGWTETVLYSFAGGSGGTFPLSLLLGQDGNFYGTTLGGTGGGLIFQLVPSGGGWTENILASFNGCVRSGSGGSCNPVLIQESSGNFYALDSYTQEFNHPPFGDFWWTFSQIFMMSPAGSGWQFTVLDDTSYLCQPAGQCYGYDEGYVPFRDLAIDSAGNLYGTWGWEEGSFEAGAVFKLLQPYQEQGLVRFAGDNFRDVEVDASGQLYGTTYRCGDSYGTVWQLTP